MREIFGRNFVSLEQTFVRGPGCTLAPKIVAESIPFSSTVSVLTVINRIKDFSSFESSSVSESEWKILGSKKERITIILQRWLVRSSFFLWKPEKNPIGRRTKGIEMAFCRSNGAGLLKVKDCKKAPKKKLILIQINLQNVKNLLFLFWAKLRLKRIACMAFYKLCAKNDSKSCL